MKQLLIIISVFGALFLNNLQGQSVVFNDYFKDTPPRLDYFHTGNSAEKIFAVDCLLSDGPWPGNTTHLLDELILGTYFFEVEDTTTEGIIFSRGFASIFGEWKTTPEAEHWETFHESLCVLWPQRPIGVYIGKCQNDNPFHRIWHFSIDPAARYLGPVPLPALYPWWVDFCNGKPEHMMDIIVMDNGYSVSRQKKCKADVERLLGEFFAIEPFKLRKTDIIVGAVGPPFALEGIYKPHPGILSRSNLSLSYGVFDAERYVLGFDNRILRNVASTMTNDFTFIIVNERTYGSGGIYNLYELVFADNKFSDYIFVHELVHHFDDLAYYVYYTLAAAYQAPDTFIEPWEPNITALKKLAKFLRNHLVEGGTPFQTHGIKKNSTA